MDTHGTIGPRHHRRWIIAAATAASAAALLAIWVLGSHPAALPAPGSAAPHSAATEGSATDAPSVAATPRSLRIPGIGVATGLVGLGLRDDGTVEVPRDPDAAGWFDRGTSPGQPGSAVILGHVDSGQGPAVFYRLHELVRGDRILVRLSDGTTGRFSVVRVVTYPNDEFPAQRVYAGTPRRATLNLVTCGGEYRADAGGYQANVVVYSELIRKS